MPALCPFGLDGRPQYLQFQLIACHLVCCGRVVELAASVRCPSAGACLACGLRVYEHFICLPVHHRRTLLLTSCRFTGADLYALCSDAWMGALKRAIAAAEAGQQRQQQQQLEQGEDGPLPASGTAETAAQQQQQQQADGSGSTDEDEEVEVQQGDFLAAVQSVQPSLSVKEVAKYEAIRDEYESQAAKSKRY